MVKYQRKLKRLIVGLITALLVVNQLSLFTPVYAQDQSADLRGISRAAAETLLGAASEGTSVLAFTSDIHNSSNNTAANRLDGWLDSVEETYGGIDLMSFCGDMGEAGDTSDRWWDYVQAVMNVVSNKGLPGVYTTGNHEFYNGHFSTTSNAVKNKYIVGEVGAEGSNYIIYCLGTDNWNNNSDNYPTSQIEDLRNDLAGLGNDKPIIILTHFPLHYFGGGSSSWGGGGRQTTNADRVIDVLNEAVNSGKKIVLLWGHNHTVSDTHYDQVYTPGSTIEYSRGNSKTVDFYYAAAGCMSDTEYNSGSAFVKGKGLVITVDAEDQLSFAYYDKSNNLVSSYTEGPEVEAESISIPETLSVASGSTANLTVTFTPAETTDRAVTWTSSDTSVATVSSSGAVTGVARGTATITATYTSNPSLTDTCEVTVTGNSDYYEIPEGDYYIFSDDNYYLTTNAGETYTNGGSGSASYNYTGLAGIADINQGAKWTFVKNGDGYYIMNGDQYLSGSYVSNSSGGYDGSLSLSSTPDTWFIVKSTANGDGLILKSQNASTGHTAGDKFLSHGNASGSGGTDANTFTVRSNNENNTATKIKYYDESGSEVTPEPGDGGGGGTDPVDPTGSVNITPSTDNPAVSATINVGDTLAINVTNGSSNSGYNYTATSGDTSIATVQGSATINIGSGATGQITVQGVAAGTVDITIQNDQSSSQYVRRGVVHLTVVSGSSTPVDVTGVTLDREEASVAVGRTVKLTATVQPSNATNKNVSWSSSDTSVATVSNGTVTGVKTGTATITVTTEDGNKTDTARITVTEAPTGTTYTRTDTLSAGGEYLIVSAESGSAYALANSGSSMGRAAVTISGSGSSAYIETTDESIVWTTSASDTAGKVHLKNGSGYLEGYQGEVVIHDSLSYSDRGWTYTGNQLQHTGGQNTYVVYYNGSAFAGTYNSTSDKVYLFERSGSAPADVPVDSITVTPRSLTLDIGEAGNIAAEVLPANATDKTVTWTSSDTSVATVSASGRVTGVSAGTATITAAAGGKSATATVTVKGPAGTFDLSVTGPELADLGADVTYSLDLESAEYNNYAAADITLTYDTARLTVKSLPSAATDSNGTIRILDYGANKQVRNGIYTLTFTTKAEGEAKVTISKASFIDSDSAASSDMIEATLAVPSVTTLIGDDFGAPTYTWSDDYSEVTASHTKEHSGQVETETVKTTSAVTKEATCEGKGETTYTAVFTNEAFSTQTKVVANIDALGHIWGEAEYFWSGDNKRASATHTCTRDDSHTETESVNTTAEITKEATCEDKGETTYTAAFTKEGFETQTKTAADIDPLGHDWGEPTYEWAEDNSTVTATRICKRDETHVDSETVKTTQATTWEATCDDPGEVTYTAKFENEAFATQTKTEMLDKIGHDWGEVQVLIAATCTEDGTGIRTCSRNATHMEIVTIPATGHALTHIEAKAASCEEAGNKEYWICENCGELFADEAAETATTMEAVTIPPTGHKWDEGKVTTPATCTEKGVLTYTCELCGETKTEEIAALGHKLTAVAAKEAGCEEDGNTAYWICENCGHFFGDAEAAAEIEEGSWIIPATGHDWADPVWTWAEDHSEATAKFVCKNDPEHVDEVKAEEVNSTETEPTYTADGGTTYYAVVSHDGKAFMDVETVVIPALKHVESITITPESIEIPTESNYTLEVEVLPEDAHDKTVTWTSSDEKVATVDEKGVVTAHTYGKATITATTADGEKTAECAVQTRYWDVPDKSVSGFTYVYWAADNGITTGVGNVYFDPNGACTRTQMVMFLWKMYGSPKVSGTLDFPDVTSEYGPSTRTYQAILWAVQQGFVKGYSDGTFGGNDTITRAQFVTILWKAAGKPTSSNYKAVEFPDVRDNPKYGPTSQTYKVVQWAVNEGITKGMTDGNFGVNEPCTRLHTVTFLNKFNKIMHLMPE